MPWPVPSAAVIVVADLPADAVELAEPSDFTRFHVEIQGDGDLAAVLAPFGRLDGEHAWIDVEALASLAGADADAQWRTGLDAMVGYARENGFLSDDGAAIRAHLERG
jgi:hypothetical protein